MEKALLMIVGLVLAVAAAGILTVTDFAPLEPDITGRVVDAGDVCGECTGEPVCAAKAEKVKNYASACDARCDEARIIYDAICERIPHAS